MSFIRNMSSEATPSTGIYELLAWLETNKKTLIIAFLVAVVLGFGIAIYRYSAERKELAASDALLKLKTPLDATESSPPPAGSAYIKVAEEFPGTPAAERAQLLAGTAFFSNNQYAEAQDQFNKFLRQYPQSSFAATAAYGIAAALEAQGKQDEALAAYQNLSVRYPNATVLDDAKLATARIFEAKNQPQQAFRVYEEFLKPGAVSSASTEARSRRQALLVQHPEFAQTNAPAAAMTVPAAVTLTNAVSAPATNAPAPTP